VNETTKENLNNIFDMSTSNTSLEVAVVGEVLPAIASSPVQESDAERLAREDFEFSRGSLKSVAVEVQGTLHRAVEVAEQTDTPRAFEAVADLARATLESHRELQQLHKTSAEIRIAAKTAQAPTSQVNIDKGIVFNGSPDELLKLIDPSRQ